MATTGMPISLLLIATGAILRWAVTADVSGVSLRAVGLILVIIGLVGLVLSLFEMLLWAPQRRRTAVPVYTDRAPDQQPPM